MDDDTLLETLLKNRPESLHDAAVLTHLDPDRVAASVSELRELGLIGGVGDGLTYPAPAEWATEAVAALTREVRATTEDALRSIEEILEALPTALRAWAVGEAATDELYLVVRYGPYAAEDLRWELSGRPSADLVAVFTSIDHLVNAPAERAQRFSDSLSERDAVRVIVPASAVADPGNASAWPSTAGSGSSTDPSNRFRAGSGSTATSSRSRTRGGKPPPRASSACATRAWRT